MLQKRRRVIDAEAYAAAKKPYSELSGERTFGAPVHHIIPRSVGGPDHPYNLIQLTGREHMAAHSAWLSQQALFAIVARREGISAADLLEKLKELRGRDVCR